MNKKHLVIPSIVAATLLSLALSACSSPSPTENAASACTAYEALATAVSAAKISLDSSSTLEEIGESRDAVKDAYAELSGALDTVSADRQAALKSAWTEFDTAVSNIDENLTVPEAARELRDDVLKIEAAQRALEEDLSC